MAEEKQSHWLLYFFDIFLKIIVYLMGIGTIYAFKDCKLAEAICSNEYINFLCGVKDAHVALFFTFGFICTMFLNENRIADLWQKVEKKFKESKESKNNEVSVLKWISSSAAIVIFFADNFSGLFSLIKGVGFYWLVGIIAVSVFFAAFFYITDFEPSVVDMNETLKKYGVGKQLTLIIIFLGATHLLSYFINKLWHFVIAGIIWILARLIISVCANNNLQENHTK